MEKSVSLGLRISQQLHSKFLAEQKRLEKQIGTKLTMNQVARILLEKGLEASVEAGAGASGGKR